MFPIDGQDGNKVRGLSISSFVDLSVSNFEDRLFPLLEIAGRP